MIWITIWPHFWRILDDEDILIDDDASCSQISIASSAPTSFNIPIDNNVDPEHVNGSTLPATRHDQQIEKQKISDCF